MYQLFLFGSAHVKHAQSKTGLTIASTCQEISWQKEFKLLAGNEQEIWLIIIIIIIKNKHSLQGFSIPIYISVS